MTGYLSNTKAEIDGREGEILQALGVGWPNGRRTHILCPLPSHNDRSPSWRWDDRRRRWHCTCGAGDILDLAQAMQGLADLVQAADWARQALGLPGRDGHRETPAERRAREARIAEARRMAEERQRQREAEDAEDAARTLARIRESIWPQVMNLGGSPAEVYLRSRGIDLPAWPWTLGFLDAYGAEKLPAMIAFFGIPIEHEPGLLSLRPEQIAGIHLTFLQPDGSGKAVNRDGKAKVFVGRGHALPIVLAPPNDGLGLIIGEGIEDCLTLHQETGLGCWAAGAANRLPGLAPQVPACIECATIIEDDDGAGRKGTKELATALHRRGIEVRIMRGRAAHDEAA